MRILIIHNNRIGLSEPYSDTMYLRSLFSSFHRDDLMQIYNNEVPEPVSYCRHCYKTTHLERRFSTSYRLLYQATHCANSNGALQKKTGVSLLRKSGLQEILFPPRLTDTLMSFIESNHPDLIYTQGYHLSNLMLTVKIADKYKIPYAVHPLDDWAKNRLHQSVAQILLSPVWVWWTRNFIMKANWRFAISISMKTEYERRYGVKWSVLPVSISIHNSTEASDFQYHFSLMESKSDTIEFTYAGSLMGGRAETLKKLAKVLCRKMTECEGVKYVLKIYTRSDAGMLDNSDDVQECLEIYDAISIDKLFPLLQASDVLVLAESFDDRHAKYDRYVLSSKVGIYLQARRPIMVLGSSQNGTVADAVMNEWAHTCTENSEDCIEKSVSVVLSNAKNLVHKSTRYYEDKLDMSKISRKLYEDLNG